MNLFYFLDYLDNLFPSEFALKDDRIGLQIHSGNIEIENLLIAYEITPEVVAEAVGNKCDTILVFHPLIYQPLREISQTERVGRLTTLLLKNNISLISLHTRFDVVQNGTSFLFARELGLEDCKILDKNPINENFGMGCYGSFSQNINISEFLEKIQLITGSPIRYSIGKSEKIRSVGIVGGSGSSFIDKAMKMNLDAYITADVSYHNFHLTKNKITLVDAGHFETEKFIVPSLTNIISKDKQNEFNSIVSSQVNTNPVQYYPIQAKKIESQTKIVKNSNFDINNNKV